MQSSVKSKYDKSSTIILNDINQKIMKIRIKNFTTETIWHICGFNGIVFRKSCYQGQLNSINCIFEDKWSTIHIKFKLYSKICNGLYFVVVI